MVLPPPVSVFSSFVDSFSSFIHPSCYKFVFRPPSFFLVIVSSSSLFLCFLELNALTSRHPGTGRHRLLSLSVSFSHPSSVPVLSPFTSSFLFPPFLSCFCSFIPCSQVQLVIARIQRAVYLFEGSLNKFLVDDKGLTERQREKKDRSLRDVMDDGTHVWAHVQTF